MFLVYSATHCPRWTGLCLRRRWWQEVMDLSLISVWQCPSPNHDDTVPWCQSVVDVLDDGDVEEGYLVSNLVSPLLDGLDVLLDNWGLLDASWGWEGVGGGLGESETVAHGSGDIVSVGHGGSGGDSGGGGDTSGVGVGEGSVEEDLSLSGGGGKSENNLKYLHKSTKIFRNISLCCTDVSLTFLCWQQRNLQT